MFDNKRAARRVVSWVIAFLVAVGLAGVAAAMRVSPMVVEMTSTGSGAVARIEVQNLNQANLPFETRVTRIDYDDKGEMVETPADGDFLVFPPQGMLTPGARQVVRLQWAGPADLASSRGYYVSVNQLPVQLTPGAEQSPAAQVQVVYHMKALVVVAPPGASPKVEVVSAKPVTILPPPPPGAPGAKPATAAAAAAPATPPVPGVEVTVRNTGARYAMMAGATWTIEGKDTAGKPLTVTLTQDDLNRSVGVGYLAALTGRRTFQVPTGTAFGPGPIKVRFGK